MKRSPGHPVELNPPYYGAGERAALHRYMAADFVPRYQQGLAANSLADPAGEDWYSGDRFSRHDDTLVLRLPTHRTFYIFACEVVCKRPGSPALDPDRVSSAGFVIRRVGAAGSEAVVAQDDTQVSEHAWMLEDGEPVGWRNVDGELRDPDLGRRLCANGVRRRDATRPPVFTGEETHPLHPGSARDADGKRHTLLFGYVPLGGQYYATGSPFSTAAEDDARDADRATLPWPFSYVGTSIADRWEDSHGRLVVEGRPSRIFFELLEVLVNRYHLGESVDDDNESLAAFAEGLQLTDPIPRTRVQKGHGPKGLGAAGDGLETIGFVARYSLLRYLEDCASLGGDNPLVQWLIRQDEAISDAGGASLQLEPLPGRPGSGADTVSESLTIGSADAQELRELLGERLVSAARRTGNEIPIPKFRQEIRDRFQILPFVRALDDDGRERITWGTAVRSDAFRVAAPFDPDASRPVAIQMPSLHDLKRGMAKGAAMIIPPDTQSLINALKLNKGASKEAIQGPGGPSLGIQWICSFSLPVITLVAMILLMIMIALLNILFFWLPWVRICLPFPKIE